MSIEQIFVTRDCFRNCDYCFARDILKKKDEMTIEDFKFYLKFLKQISPPNPIHFLGGEPFNHPKFKEILKLTIEWSFEIVRISTGGIFNNKILEEFDLSNFQFIVSYPNNSQEEKSISKNIKYILDRKGTVSLSIVMNEDFDAEKAIEFVLKNNIKTANPNMSLPNIHKTNKYLKKPSKKFKSIFLYMLNKLYENNIEVGQHCFTPLCIFNREEHKKYSKHNFPFGKCTISEGEFVYPNLDIYICPNFDDKVGNIKENTFKEIQDNKMKLISKVKHEMMPLCRECVFKEKGFCLPCAAYSY